MKINFQKGESVKIKEGPFENFDGIVDDVYPDKGLVRVVVTIFSRPTPVELEYWQVEPI
jgi:transcriptional antiterminator NusG